MCGAVEAETPHGVLKIVGGPSEEADLVHRPTLHEEVAARARIWGRVAVAVSTEKGCQQPLALVYQLERPDRRCGQARGHRRDGYAGAYVRLECPSP